MTKLPRDLSGLELQRALERQGYRATRTAGSHVRLTHPGPPQHHVTIPLHSALKVGTLAAILDELGMAWKLDRGQVLRKLLG